MRDIRNAYNRSVGKSEWKRPVGQNSHRWEHKIRINLIEIGCEDVNWIRLTQNRALWRTFLNTVMNLRVP